MSNSVTLAAARAVIEAARKHAEKIGVPHEHRRGRRRREPRRLRPDGRGLARQHRHRPGQGVHRPRLRHPTKELAKQSQPGEPLFGITASNDGRVVIFAGGVPLKSDGQVVGAIGASGGRPDQDHSVAEAGAAAFAAAAEAGR